MFKFNTYLTNYSLQKYEENIDSFKKNINDIQNLYKLLTKLIGKKPINIIDNDIELISPIKQATKEKLIEMTDDEFLDAIEGEKTEIENNNSEDKHNDSEKYHDSDDSDTVYQKAKKNTNVRTTRRVNKGSNVVNLNKQKIDKYYK
jgi:rubrerythrin